MPYVAHLDYQTRDCPPRYVNGSVSCSSRGQWLMDYRVDNPAGEVIRRRSCQHSQPSRRTFKALPYAGSIGRARRGRMRPQLAYPTKLCFRWLVLTAARSGEARSRYNGSDIDLEAKTQTIPADHE